MCNILLQNIIDVKKGAIDEDAVDLGESIKKKEEKMEAKVRIFHIFQAVGDDWN